MTDNDRFLDFLHRITRDEQGNWLLPMPYNAELLEALPTLDAELDMVIALHDGDASNPDLVRYVTELRGKMVQLINGTLPEMPEGAERDEAARLIAHLNQRSLVVLGITP